MRARADPRRRDADPQTLKAPRRIETPRLLLRAYEPDDAAAFGDLLAANRGHYGAFIPFFLAGDPAERVRDYRAAFDAGESFTYAALAGERLIGGGGLLRRVGPGALEVGYHVRADEGGRGYGTEIARALISVAFEICGVERVELHIAPENAASIAVAERVGASRDRARESAELAVYTLLRQVG